MFHLEPDASKVALVALVGRMRDQGASLLDVQWRTDHLARLGAVEVPRPHYLERLAVAIDQELTPIARESAGPTRSPDPA
jgi:leucyl/phenylalanyl-tRNA--protein transferase